MADAVWHLGEIVVSEDDPATSLWPGHIFPPQTNVDCCEREQYKLGICSRGLNIYNSFQQGQGMPVVSANGLGHLLATEEMKGCSQPLFLTERLVPPAPLGSSIAMAPQCHSLSTVSKLGNTAGDMPGVGCEVWDHFLPANTGPKHIFTRLLTWLNSPSHPCVSAGIAWTITQLLVFVFPGAVLQIVMWKLFFSQQPQVSLAMLTSQCWLGKVTSSQPRGTPVSMWGAASVVSPVSFLFPP